MHAEGFLWLLLTSCFFRCLQGNCRPQGKEPATHAAGRDICRGACLFVPFLLCGAFDFLFTSAELLCANHQWRDKVQNCFVQMTNGDTARFTATRALKRSHGKPLACTFSRHTPALRVIHCDTQGGAAYAASMRATMACSGQVRSG